MDRSQGIAFRLSKALVQSNLKNGLENLIRRLLDNPLEYVHIVKIQKEVTTKTTP